MTTLEAAELWCEEQKYPVLVRPSFVLSGAAMNTVYSKTGLANYLNQAAEVSENLVGQYFPGYPAEAHYLFEYLHH